MNYTEFVLLREEDFKKSMLLKVAKDLAAILDHQISQIPLKADEAKKIKIAELRDLIFNRFCGVCWQVGADLPPLEMTALELYLPKDPAKKGVEEFEGKMIKEFVFSSLKGKHIKDATVCRAAARLLELFPIQHHITKKELTALINATLISFGLEPFRPDYSEEVGRHYPTKESGPNCECPVMIVDDNESDFFVTAMALVGWPNLKIEFLLVEPDYSAPRPKRAEKLIEVAMTIIREKPRIVLMDRGMYPLEGDEVVLKCRELNNTAANPIFIANTGGSGSEMAEIGIKNNFDKGRESDAMRWAISQAKT